MGLGLLCVLRSLAAQPSRDYPFGRQGKGSRYHISSKGGYVNVSYASKTPPIKLKVMKVDTTFGRLTRDESRPIGQ